MEPEELKELLIERRNTEYREESPWRSRRNERVYARARFKVKRNHITERFDDHVYANMDIDVETKTACLLVSPSVVSLVSLEGGYEMSRTSGTIIESNNVGGKYSNTILTSASLFESSDGNVVVKVYLHDGRVFEGRICAYDRHYNLAIINIKSEIALPVAVLRFLDDSASVDPREVSPSGDMPNITPHVEANSFRCIPGEMVVAVGRHADHAEIMVAPGRISLDVCSFDCKELTMATCKISKCGIGGPLVNRDGEVIGVNFYDELYTPFLPTNTVSKCLEYFKKNRRFCRPCHGMEVINLYAADLKTLETIVFKFDIFRGVIVRKVLPGSPADVAGIIPGDVIIECSGEKTQGRIEFLRQMWEKARESVELVVVRKGTDGLLKLSMVVANETRPMKFNRWPVPKECFVNVRRVRPRDLEDLEEIQ